jgi:hypothetical protein
VNDGLEKNVDRSACSLTYFWCVCVRACVHTHIDADIFRATVYWAILYLNPLAPWD